MGANRSGDCEVNSPVCWVQSAAVGKKRQWAQGEGRGGGLCLAAGGGGRELWLVNNIPLLTQQNQD